MGRNPGNPARVSLGLGHTSALVISIRAYWWPDDGSETVIESYEVEVHEVDGSGDLAYLRGRGSLTFTYRPLEGPERRIESESVHLSIVRRDAGGRWRIIRRAWISQQ